MGSSWGSHPIAIPWNALGASHGELHGLLLWVAHGIHQWAFHGMPLGLLIGGFHGMALWLVHGGGTNGIPWHAIGTSHVGSMAWLDG